MSTPTLVLAVQDEQVSPLPAGRTITSSRRVRPGSVYLARVHGDVAEVLETLATAGSVRAELYRLAAEHAMRAGYPEEVLREVADWQQRPGIHDPALTDLSALPFITIDNEDSRDLDQALFIDEDADGWLVRYALADAAYYVRPGSALMAEALLRGVSYYLPGFAFPMLPAALSEGLISLNPDQLRRSLVLNMRVDRTGRCIETTMERARIKSAAKLSYDGVQRFYDAPESSPLSGRPFTAVLERLRAVGRLRIAEARGRDIVSYQRRDVEVRWGDAEGITFALVGDERNDTERYNEQISLLCNSEGARLLQAWDAPSIWRVHPAPPEPRLERLAAVAAGVARHHGHLWRWRPRHKSDGSSVADLLRAVRAEASPSVQAAVERAAMVSNVRSVFTEEPGAHHGVGAERYARFSSPMREVVGIYTHAAALQHLGLSSWPEQGGAALREAVIQAGNDGQSRQRALTKAANKLVLDHYFSPDLGLSLQDRPWRPGAIIELRNNRAYVRLDSPPLEVKLYEHDLGTRRQLSQGGAVLKMEGAALGELALGASVEVRVRAYERNQWQFDLRPGQ